MKTLESKEFDYLSCPGNVVLVVFLSLLLLLLCMCARVLWILYWEVLPRFKSKCGLKPRRISADHAGLAHACHTGYGHSPPKRSQNIKKKKKEKNRKQANMCIISYKLFK